MKHDEMVAKLFKREVELSLEDSNLLHAAIGIAGEAGEILDIVKKVVFYRQRFDKAMVDWLIEELGDMEFYLQAFRDLVLISREEALKANMDKLAKRYPDFNYSDARAKERADKQ